MNDEIVDASFRRVIRELRGRLAKALAERDTLVTKVAEMESELIDAHAVIGNSGPKIIHLTHERDVLAVKLIQVEDALEKPNGIEISEIVAAIENLMFDRRLLKNITSKLSK